MKVYNSTGCADAMVSDALALEAHHEQHQMMQCPSCPAAVEQWWSYCAMCGFHIASGSIPGAVGGAR